MKNGVLVTFRRSSGVTADVNNTSRRVCVCVCFGWGGVGGGVYVYVRARVCVRVSVCACVRVRATFPGKKLVCSLPHPHY